MKTTEWRFRQPHPTLRFDAKRRFRPRKSREDRTLALVTRDAQIPARRLDGTEACRSIVFDQFEIKSAADRVPTNHFDLPGTRYMTEENAIGHRPEGRPRQHWLPGKRHDDTRPEGKIGIGCQLLQRTAEWQASDTSLDGMRTDKFHETQKRIRNLATIGGNHVIEERLAWDV